MKLFAVLAFALVTMASLIAGLVEDREVKSENKVKPEDLKKSLSEECANCIDADCTNCPFFQSIKDNL